MIDLSQIDWQFIIQQFLSNLGMPVAFIAGGLISFITNWQSNRHQTALQDRQYARDKLFTAYQDALSSLFDIIEFKMKFGDDSNDVEVEILTIVKKYFAALSILESLTQNHKIRDIEKESQEIFLTPQHWSVKVRNNKAKLKEIRLQLKEIFKADTKFHL